MSSCGSLFLCLPLSVVSLHNVHAHAVHYTPYISSSTAYQRGLWAQKTMAYIKFCSCRLWKKKKKKNLEHLVPSGKSEHYDYKDILLHCGTGPVCCIYSSSAVVITRNSGDFRGTFSIMTPISKAKFRTPDAYSRSLTRSNIQLGLAFYQYWKDTTQGNKKDP